MNGAVAAGHELTARAGAEALARGGTAIDAAVAAGAMSWASEPALTGPCGGGFLLIRCAESQSVHLLDAFTAVPGRDLEPGRPLDDLMSVLVPFDETTTQVFHIGAAACAVPGVVAGLEAAHRRFGRLPWRDLLLPAARVAREGVAMTPNQLAVCEAIRPVLTSTPESAALFQPYGHYIRVGEPVRQPDLADTIELLAEQGAGALYTGALADAMVGHQAVTGGRLTHADLAAYRPIWRRPLTAPYRGDRLVTNPPPSSGGVLVAYALSVLDGIDGDSTLDGALGLRAVAETMRAATRMRDGRFEVLLHRGGLASHVLAPAAVERGREAVRAALAGQPSAAVAVPSDAGTTHISALDDEGTAVAFTASNGCHSGVIVPGTGLHLNNMMGEEDLFVGRPQPPGARLTSMQAPTLVVDRHGMVRMVVGSSGSNRVRSAVVQVVRNVMALGMSLREAVDAPRLHTEAGRLDCEGGFDPGDLDVLERWGENVVRFAGLNLYFGGANAVRVWGDGTLEAAGDPRRDGFGVVI
jgi:gamma-glutamyltranspeptidase/glutathione hydrolase